MRTRIGMWLVALSALTYAAACGSSSAYAEDAKKKEEMAPLDIVLPTPKFEGTPKDVKSRNLGPVTGVNRSPFMAPKGLVNVARGKPVTASEKVPIAGELPMITDGDKEAADGSFVEFGPGPLWVQVDLQGEHEIFAIVVWHFHSQARVYHDFVVQVSDDPDFVKGVRTIFNNDDDNSAKLGIGADKEYIETAEGHLVDVKGVKARYVRCYSNGNTTNDLNHMTEIEVFGRPAQ